MKTITYKFNDGTVSEVEVSVEIYEALRAEDRPFEREEKRKQRRGLSLEQFLEDNDFEIGDESSDFEACFIVNEMEKERTEKIITIRNALSFLTKEQREIVKMRYEICLGLQEIAEIKGITYQAIQCRISTILEKLKKLSQKSLV